MVNLTQSQAELLVRKVIQDRREEDGFTQKISQFEWSSLSVCQKVTDAGNYFVENCCEADAEDLLQNLRPDDFNLEDALRDIERVLNGLMAFKAEKDDGKDDGPAKRENFMPPSKKTHKDIPIAQTAEQSEYASTALNYLYWLIEGDEWTKDFRRNLPFPLTEKQMVDCLLSPLTEVLSFEDFRSLGLCPICTTGRVSLKRENKIAAENLSKAQEPLIRIKNHDYSITTYEFEVEVDRPDGTVALLTITRTGKMETMQYRSNVIDGTWWHPNRSATGDTTPMIWQEVFCDGLLDRIRYPDTPNFNFRFYPGSIGWDVHGYCDTLLENQFYTDFDLALRYLLMFQRSALYEFSASQSSIYVPQWHNSLGGKYRLTIPAWVLPEELADYWRQIRPRGARERSLPSVAYMEIFNFVLDNSVPGSLFKWAELARTWSECQKTTMTRDRLYKVYISVLKALFPGINLRLSQMRFNYSDMLYKIYGRHE